jgi:hypothetical protein
MAINIYGTGSYYGSCGSGYLGLSDGYGPYDYPLSTGLGVGLHHHHHPLATGLGIGSGLYDPYDDFTPGIYGGGLYESAYNRPYYNSIYSYASPTYRYSLRRRYRYGVVPNAGLATRYGLGYGLGVGSGLGVGCGSSLGLGYGTGLGSAYGLGYGGGLYDPYYDGALGGPYSSYAPSYALSAYRPYGVGYGLGYGSYARCGYGGYLGRRRGIFGVGYGRRFY